MFVPEYACNPAHASRNGAKHASGEYSIAPIAPSALVGRNAMSATCSRSCSQSLNCGIQHLCVGYRACTIAEGVQKSCSLTG